MVRDARIPDLRNSGKVAAGRAQEVMAMAVSTIVILRRRPYGGLARAQWSLEPRGIAFSSASDLHAGTHLIRPRLE